MEPHWRPPTPQGQACEEVRAEADSTSASGAEPCSVCGHVASLGSQSASKGAGFDLESTGWWMGSGKCTLIAALQTVPVPQPSPWAARVLRGCGSCLAPLRCLLASAHIVLPKYVIGF